ncbi:hypothetical protein [Parasphingorhabdus sp.]|uniref:hypothetical protein n=1 Tax=Parasphingorhabdus sp. TaxID=2709688 RepID=UPI003D2E1A89
MVAVDWLTSLVPSDDWERRLAAVEQRFQLAKERWAQGDRVALFDGADTVAWYLHQAHRYADPDIRQDCFIPACYRIAPLLRRIGQLKPTLMSIAGAEERAHRMLIENIVQPDDGIYELLVAGAYARRGWSSVKFVDEAPGLEKRQDLLASRGDEEWAIECKRSGRSGYAAEERIAGEKIAEKAHELARARGASLIILARFKEELNILPHDYLETKTRVFLKGTEPYEWSDEHGEGAIFPVDWTDLYSVMRHDDIFFGSSRMVELLLGHYEPSADFSMAGDWTPADGRPLHSSWVNQLSLVVWRSSSEEAARRKATHFRSLVSRAANQLPGNIPGVVHVGYEAVGGNSVDNKRHELNRREMATFNPASSGLRIVYGNYFMHELVTARNESAAVSETLAWYPVEGGESDGPLPGHMLFMDENGELGSHW